MSKDSFPRFYDYSDMQKALHQEGSPIVIRQHKHHDPDLPLHSHNFIEIVVVNSGRGRHILETYEHPLLAGDVFIIPRGVKHGYVNEEQLVITNILFQMTTIEQHFPEIMDMQNFFSFFMADAVPGTSENDVCHLMNLTNEELVYLEDLLLKIVKEQSRQRIGTISMCLTYLGQILIYFIRLLESRPEEQVLLNAQGRFSMVYGYINKHLDEKITIKRLASLAYMSSRNFQRIFTGINDMSPSLYLLKARLEKSRDYLKDTDWDIGTVARKVGFCEHSYFSRQFKKLFGMSPRQFRTTMKDR